MRLEAAEIPLTGTLHARVEVSNTGRIAGEEIVQFYVGYPRSGVERPVRKLKGFTRLHLEPGETRTAELALPAERLAYYDESQAS